jgi:hypothetical protein
LTRSLATVSALALLGGCATTPTTSAHLAQPGYRCLASLQGDSSASAESVIYADGRPHDASLQWGMRFAVSQFIDAGVLAITYNAHEADLGNGLGTVRWAFTPPMRGRHRLELTTAPDSVMASRTPFATQYERDQHLGIMVPWQDLLAYARSADSLTLVIRHVDGHEVLCQEIDPAAFRRADGEIAQVQAELRDMLADYRDRCEFVDDVDPQIILA